MSSCHHAVKKKGDMRSQRNSIYNINIIYTISLSPHTAFFCKILNGMMTLRHDDIMTRLYDALWIDVALVCCLWVQGGRRRSGILFFWQTSVNSLQKSTTLSANSHKGFHQTFTKLSPTFTKLSPKGPKRGEKWPYFHFFFHFLSPEPIFLGGVERFAYLCTVSWDQRGPLTVLVFYSPHSAVLPPAPASWQSNRSITIGREKARRKTKKRTMRISHS